MKNKATFAALLLCAPSCYGGRKGSTVKYNITCRGHFIFSSNHPKLVSNGLKKTKQKNPTTPPVFPRWGLTVFKARARTFPRTQTHTQHCRKIIPFHLTVAFAYRRWRRPVWRNQQPPRWLICCGPEWSWYITSRNLVLNHKPSLRFTLLLPLI